MKKKFLSGICIVLFFGCLFFLISGKIKKPDSNIVTDKSFAPAQSEQNNRTERNISPKNTSDKIISKDNTSPKNSSKDKIVKENLSKKDTSDTNTANIMIEKDGNLFLAEGNINEAFSFLPGYKKIPVQMENINENFIQVFKCLQKSEKRKNETPLERLDGAGISVNYNYQGKDCFLTLYSAADNQSVLVNISGGDFLYSEMLVSKEAHQFIHKQSGWKEFDLAKLNQINSITAQIVEGYQASNETVIFSKDETKDIINSLLSSAYVTDEGSCGYNIQLQFYKDDNFLYQGYLSGDSCAQIGLESQYFHIDSDTIRQIYKKLNYDMPVR